MRVLVCVRDNLIMMAVKAVLAEGDLTVIDGSATPSIGRPPGAVGSPDVVACMADDLSATAQCGARDDRPPIVALLPQPRYELVSEALRWGAAGVHCVNCHLLELPTAVRAIGAGAPAWFAPCAAAIIAAHLAGRGTCMGDYGLTPRESLILNLIAQGATNGEVAGELGLQIRTVKHHTSSVFRKLGARNRSEAVALAYRLGLVA